MSTLQYHLIVKKGVTTSETGSFFLASPFRVLIDEHAFDCCFSRTTDKVVVQAVTMGNKTICNLTHPDYAPDCPPSNLKDVLGLDQAETLFKALVTLKITKGDTYPSFFSEDNTTPYTFEVEQRPLFK